MQRRDRCLHRERSRPAAQCLLDQRQRFRNLMPIPSTPILLFEDDQVAAVIRPRIPPRIMQQHEREKPTHLRRRLRSHQRLHQPAKTDRLRAQIATHERIAPRRRVPFVEDQVDHGEHSIQPFRQVARLRHDVRNARIPDLALRSHQTLRHRRAGNQKSPRDLVGIQAAKRAQGQRHLRLRGQRRVATGENQAKAIVGDLLRVVVRLLRRPAEARHYIGLQFFLKPPLPPHAVDGLVASRLDDPCSREFGHAGRRPLVHSGRKRFLSRLFGRIEVPEQPNQRGDDSAPVRAIQRFQGGGNLLGHAR